MSFGNIFGTINTLVQLGISEALALELRSFLEASAEELTGSAPEEVGNNQFGQSPASLQCSYDAGRARKHVNDAIKDMAAGLQGYGTIVTDLYREANEIDQTAAQEIDTKTDAVQACVPVSFAAPPSCGLPGNSGEDH